MNNGINYISTGAGFLPSRVCSAIYVYEIYHIICEQMHLYLHVPGSKLLILGMVIPPLIGNPYTYNGHIHPYWVDDHPLLYGNNGRPLHTYWINSTPWIMKNWSLDVFIHGTVDHHVLVGGWVFNSSDKYARQIGNLPQVGVKIKIVWNHHLDYDVAVVMIILNDTVDERNPANHLR